MPFGWPISIPAPQDCAVARLVAEPGEAIVPGQPVMTLQARGQAWTSFNLREDQLDGLTIGFPVELMPVGASISFCVRLQASCIGFEQRALIVRGDEGSETGMFGGNSNWRGPIWMPVNALIVRG